MSRDPTTGVYTRVDNSFSHPVVGTTISPTDGATFFDDVETSMNSFIGTSTTSLAIGLGAKTFTTQLTKTFLPGLYVQARSQANPTVNYMYGTVTSYTAATGALILNIVEIGGSGTLADWSLYTAGARGGAGPIAGIRQLYSSTTTDADPGAGTYRLNNATVASATAAYLDNLDTNGATVSGLIDLWDDSTNTTKGTLRFEKESDASVWAEFSVTGSVVDGTGYRKLTLTAGASNGTFTAGDAFRIAFRRAGDKGADGSVTGSTGATDTAVLRANGTGGATLQNSLVLIDGSGNVTGVAKLTTTGNIELGNASDTTLSRSAAARLAVEGKDALLKGQTDDLSTAGFISTSVSSGTKSSGTYTFDPTAGSVQHITNGGAFTLAPTTSHGSWLLDITNNASAGAITTSGWTKVDGDPLTTTNTNAFRCYMSVGNAGSHLNIKRMV